MSTADSPVSAGKTKATYAITGGGINQHGWFAFNAVNLKTGRSVELSRKRVAILRREGRIADTSAANVVSKSN